MAPTPFFHLCFFVVILVTYVAVDVEEFQHRHLEDFGPGNPHGLAHLVYHSNPSPLSCKSVRYCFISFVSSSIFSTAS